jgi:hypothetical protein
MRDYGKVHTSFWTSQTTRTMSEDARALAMYLLTCPHGTISGAFRLPDGYVCDDLQWSAERVNATLSELLSKGFANRCETTKWIWIIKHFEWNKPENPNQLKSAKKIAESIPDECFWKQDFMRLNADFLGIERKPFVNPSQTLSQPVAVAVAVAGTVTEIKAARKTRKKSELIYDDYPEFQEFWELYPNKDKKYPALEAWADQSPSIETVLHALRWQTQSDKWRRDGGQYIPLASTYINQRRWQDEQPREVAF